MLWALEVLPKEGLVECFHRGAALDFGAVDTVAFISAYHRLVLKLE